jgi:hypothetical protein
MKTDNWKLNTSLICKCPKCHGYYYRLENRIQNLSIKCQCGRIKYSDNTGGINALANSNQKSSTSLDEGGRNEKKT